MMWLGWILALIGLGALADRMGWLPEQEGSRDGADRRPKSALDVLKERYARGEIDQDEYRRIREDIGS